jgi:hypothetical protein
MGAFALSRPLTRYSVATPIPIDEDPNRGFLESTSKIFGPRAHVEGSHGHRPDQARQLSDHLRTRSGRFPRSDASPARAFRDHEALSLEFGVGSGNRAGRDVQVVREPSDRGEALPLLHRPRRDRLRDPHHDLLVDRYIRALVDRKVETRVSVIPLRDSGVDLR